jgi:hypothetical protein
MMLIPTLGPFHILHPRYNGVTVLELARAARPSAIYLASYSATDLSSKVWREANEVSFFHVLPWAEREGVLVVALDQQSVLKAEADRFREALGMYPKGQEILTKAAELDNLLSSVITQPKSPEDFAREEVLQPLREYTRGFAELFGEGPATGFRRQRLEGVASQLASRKSQDENAVILVDLLDYPMLLELLPHLSAPTSHLPSEPERQRSILDRAWRLEESDDWAQLLGQLQEIEAPEALYCAAQIYLAAGQPADALVLLDQLIHKDFQEPEYLPGYSLARYGQMADLEGERDKALRAYTAVLALDFAPQEAREIALAGRKTAFRLA